MKYIFIIIFALSVILINIGNHESFLPYENPARDNEDTVMLMHIFKYYPPDTVIVVDIEKDTSYVEITPGRWYFKHY